MINQLENILFKSRRLIITGFIAITLFMAWQASQLQVQAGFEKQLPMQHEYMQVFDKYKTSFGGANRILVALSVKEGDIFTPQFFDTLKAATDDLFFLPGVDRARVSSLFTPDVRFTEVVEDGISGGNVIPNDFTNTPEGLKKVRENLLKSNYVGRLVANDFSAALISVQLMEIDPNTGKKLDYLDVAAQLESTIRDRYQNDNGIDIHIIGFAKVVGDIADGASRVVAFFAVAFVITALLVYLYAHSFHLTIIPLICSLVAVIWQLGMLPLLGFGIDPMAILVPFLVFAIGVSHGVQMISAIGSEVFEGASALDAAKRSFRRLLIPGGIALASDTIGFITISFIEIEVIQHLAITASLGVATIIFTNLVLLPILASYFKVTERYRNKLVNSSQTMAPVWQKLANITERKTATFIIGIALILAIFGIWKGNMIRIGDQHAGIPELRSDSRYNQDTAYITNKFSIGVDLISVIAESEAEACIDQQKMSAIDDFSWEIRNVEGVQSVISLAAVAKIVNAGWNEGNLKWQTLPFNKDAMAQAIAYTPTSSGLLNDDCSAMPIMIFTKDHRAETIQRIITAVKSYREAHKEDGIQYQLATGNVGVMAATNEEVEAAQFPILIMVFGAIILLCLLNFRSFPATLCIVLPLALVSLLSYALMAILEIGLKVNTLPVAALGVGIGVDYGIYIYNRMQTYLKQGMPLKQAYQKTLTITGNGVLFTGITLAIGVATWIFSPLKFQADMGILLTFMFLVNMLGAILLLPALASWLVKPTHQENK